MGFLNENLLSGRLEIVLYAFSMMIGVHAVLLLLAFVLKKTLNPYPLIEIILRPFLVKLIDKLNRDKRSDFALIFRGVLVFFIIVACLTAYIFIIQKALYLVGYAQFTHIILMMSVMSPLLIMNAVYRLSSDEPKEGSYKYIAQSLNQNLIMTDKHGLRRAGGKAIALSLSQWVIAPILFYVLGDIEGAYLYMALNLFVRISSRDKGAFTNIFGMVYRLANAIANVFGVLIIFLSSLFSAGGKPMKVFKAFKIPSMMTESAIAFAQNITLGGAYQNRLGDTVKSPWVGADGATAKLEHKDVLRVIIQYGISIFLIFVFLLGVFLYP